MDPYDHGLEAHATFFGGIAQLVERQLCKLDVRGSNPLASTLGLVAQLVELTLDKRAVTGSSPVWPTGKRQLW